MRTGRMNLRSQISNLRLAAFTACVTLGMPLASHGAPPSEDDLGRAALAEEFSDAGIQAVNRQQVQPPMIHQSAALLKAACQEYDVEPRFPRLLAEACLQSKDVDGAIAALIKYRAIQLPEVQNDQFAQVQLIDLVISKMESLDKKLDYLKPLLGVTALPDPVRSHIAWVCWGLLSQKFDTAGAQAMLEQAVQLNPVSPEALQAQFTAAQASGVPKREAAALVALLESNPAQPAVMGALADVLATAGQPDLAVIWYKRSFVLSQTLGQGLDGGRYLNYAAALYEMDQAKSASDAAGMLLASQSSNIGAATIALLAARQAVKPQPGGAPAADPSVLQHAQEVMLAALTSQMGTLHAMLSGVTGPAATQASTTQPADLIGDVVANAPMVRDKKNQPNATQQDAAFCTGYAEALTDLIFYYTYFDSQPANAEKLLGSLRLLRPADDVELTRLEGFAFLDDGKPDEAKVKFSAIADHDPLARMGLLMMAPLDADTTTQAVKLVTDHPAGLLGAILLDGLRDKGGKPVPNPDSTTVANEAAAFPVKLLDLLDSAHTDGFYDVVAQPVHVSVGYDEPALVRVTIKNTGDYDLSIGAAGALRSDLVFDVKAQGGNNPYFASVAYDRIAGPLVLKAHQIDKPGTAQVVRVDSGALRPFLADQPTIAVSMIYSVFTNPVGQQSGLGPGPGGYRKQFTSEMERRSSPINNAQAVQNLINPAATGRQDERIRTLELLANYVSVLRQKIAHAQAQLSGAPAENPAPPAEAAGGDGAGAMPTPPVAGAAPAAPPDPKQLTASIQYMQSLIDTFTAAIRDRLRDPAAIVRYWAEAKLGELADANARDATAKSMIQGKDWQERELGLILANALPREQAKGLAELVKADPEPCVKELAAATIELADMPAAANPKTVPTPALDGPGEDNSGILLPTQ
jgi:tetratricopeptide (TPR) repeat protein